MFRLDVSVTQSWSVNPWKTAKNVSWGLCYFQVTYCRNRSDRMINLDFTFLTFRKNKTAMSAIISQLQLWFNDVNLRPRHLQRSTEGRETTSLWMTSRQTNTEKQVSLLSLERVQGTVSGFVTFYSASPWRQCFFLFSEDKSKIELCSLKQLSLVTLGLYPS